jgi:phage FluMu protein gp41
LGSQIAFQLTNENLPDTETLERDESMSTDTGLATPSSTELLVPFVHGEEINSKVSNNETLTKDEVDTTAASEDADTTPNTKRIEAIESQANEVTDCQIPVSSHQFNQLFNYVNHIDHIYLRRGEVKKIIIAFLPDSRGRGRRPAKSSEFKKDEGSSSQFDDVEKLGSYQNPSDEDDMYDFFEINGLLFFFAFKLQYGATEESFEMETPKSPPRSSDSTQLTTSMGDLALMDDYRKSYLDKTDGTETQPTTAPDCQVRLRHLRRIIHG